VLDENVALSQIHQSPGALWSLLVFSGYLKADEAYHDPMRGPVHRLSIPNREVRQVYSTTFRTWMENRMSGHGGSLTMLTEALLGGDAEALEQQLQAFVTNLLSYHDLGGVASERVYHGFVMGLFAVLEATHEVRSNRESGGGRPDVWIRPRQPGKPGVGAGAEGGAAVPQDAETGALRRALAARSDGLRGGAAGGGGEPDRRVRGGVRRQGGARRGGGRGEGAGEGAAGRGSPAWSPNAKRGQGGGAPREREGVGSCPEGASGEAARSLSSRACRGDVRCR
jgi:hypothetical protein